MASSQLQEDVVYSRDSQDNVIVDRYAKALEILEGENANVWKYERIILPFKQGIVHYAKLLGSGHVNVKGAQPVEMLTPNINYNVYVELKLEDDATGFDEPVIFNFTDLQTTTETIQTLNKGVNMVRVGCFQSSYGIFRSVSVSLSTLGSIAFRKGLVVRRISITTA